MNLQPPIPPKRVKVHLKPGRSQLDWARLKNTSTDLRGEIPLEVLQMNGRVTKNELAKHNKQTDCWMSINGNVYNLTSYLEYHPGGVPQLMRCAGSDGTRLFSEFHPYINAKMMLDKCQVGILIN